MLDAQPLIPWPLPVCPTTKFVIYRDDFTPDEITKIRKFVSSPAWSALKGESPFYRAAETMQWMGEDSENTAYMFLNATRKTTSREQSRRYDSKALEHFRNLLQSRNVETENREPNSLETEAISSWITLELITGELERRLGMFREAKERFERLAKLPAFQGNYRAKVVTLQLQLIAEGRSNPHFAP